MSVSVSSMRNIQVRVRRKRVASIFYSIKFI